MKHVAVVALALVALLGACSGSSKGTAASTHDLGTGVNTIDRKYPKPADTVWDAAVAAVKSYDLKIDSDRHDEMGGELVAHRADGHRVTAKVSALDKNNSNVSLRVEPGNRDLAQMLQERIADKLGMGEAKAAFLGGNSTDGTYSTDFQGAVSAAERVCKELNYTVTNQEIHDTWAQVDARAQDSNPVRFKMAHVDDRSTPTKVTFIAGNGKTDTSKTTMNTMKSEFERQVTSSAK